jgi:hypothetical protein
VKPGRYAALLLVLFVLPAVPDAAEQGINYINMYIRLDYQNEYGLHKLTSAERAKLNRVFGEITERLNDNLRNGALAYLESQGWSELQITGTEVLELDEFQGEMRYVTAAGKDTRYTLEPAAHSTLMQGRYLAKFDDDQCRVINPEGKVVEFTVRTTAPGRE